MKTKSTYWEISILKIKNKFEATIYRLSKNKIENIKYYYNIIDFNNRLMNISRNKGLQIIDTQVKVK